MHQLNKQEWLRTDNLPWRISPSNCLEDGRGESVILEVGWERVTFFTFKWWQQNWLRACASRKGKGAGWGNKSTITGLSHCGLLSNWTVALECEVKTMPPIFPKKGRAHSLLHKYRFSNPYLALITHSIRSSMRALKERVANNMFHRECDIYSKSLKFRSFEIIILPFLTS